MIIDLDVEFWKFLFVFFSVDVLFLSFYFLSGFWRYWWLCVTCFPELPQRVCPEVVSVSIGDWDSVSSWDDKGLRSSSSHGREVREQRGTGARFFDTELGMRLGILELAEQNERCRSAFTLLSWSGKTDHYIYESCHRYSGAEHWTGGELELDLGGQRKKNLTTDSVPCIQRGEVFGLVGVAYWI